MKNYIISSYFTIGIGLNQFFPEILALHTDTRKPKITNTIAGGVSSKAFAQAASYSGKVKINGRKNKTHGK
jgi:hypothetical protein